MTAHLLASLASFFGMLLVGSTGWWLLCDDGPPDDDEGGGGDWGPLISPRTPCAAAASQSISKRVSIRACRHRSAPTLVGTSSGFRSWRVAGVATGPSDSSPSSAAASRSGP